MKRIAIIIVLSSPIVWAAENTTQFFELHISASDQAKCRLLHQFLALTTKEKKLEEQMPQNMAISNDYNSLLQVIKQMSIREIHHNDFFIYIPTYCDKRSGGPYTSIYFLPDGYSNEVIEFHLEKPISLSSAQEIMQKLPYKAEIFPYTAKKLRQRFIEQALIKKYDYPSNDDLDDQQKK